MFGLYILNYAQGDTVQILPAYPTADDSIQVVTERCHYDTVMFSVENDTLLFFLKTDSRIDAVCAPYFDTVTIGILAPGSWILHYYYIDRAIATEDSVLYSKIIDFEVSAAMNIKTDGQTHLLMVYPNPAGYYFIIKPDFSFNTGESFITIRNIQGMILYKKKITGVTERTDISGLAAGSYIVRYNDNNNTWSGILIKN